MARLVFLGTAAALPLRYRANTSMAITPADGAGTLLIDCGGDPYRALLAAGFGPDSVGDLLITHAHIDHIGGLPSLIESFRLGGRTKPLRIVALPVVLNVAHRLIDAFDFELTLDHWTFAVEFAAVEDGNHTTLQGIPATVVAMDHSVPSVGVRLELPDGALAYTCDTQPCANIAVLAKGARTLITECTFLKDGEAVARASRHMTAAEAGEAAADCGVGRLALVHLGNDMVIAGARDEAAAAFGGEIVIPSDGDLLEV